MAPSLSPSLRMAFAVALLFGRAAAADPPASPVATCLVDGQVEDLRVVGDVVYLAGRFEHARPPGTLPGDPSEVLRRWFAACDLATGAVLPWDPQATCTTGSCVNLRGETLAVAPDGNSIYLGGRFSHVGGQARRNAARVAAADAAVLPWNPSPDGRVLRLLIAPDASRVWVGGSFTAVGGCSPAPCHAMLAATDPASGAVEAAFAPAITTSGGGFTAVGALGLSSDGATLFLGGEFDAVNGVARDAVAAVDAATGAVLAPFAPRLEDADPLDPVVQVHDLAVTDDWIYVCGDWWATEGIGGEHDQRNVNRFDVALGAADLDFWVGTDGGVQACALDHGSARLVVGGQFDCVRAWLDSGTPADPAATPCGSDPLFLGTWQRDLFALDLASGELAGWNPDPAGAGGAWALAVADGRIAAGGDLGWPRVGTPTHQNLLVFAGLPFADGFEGGDLSRWSLAFP